MGEGARRRAFKQGKVVTIDCSQVGYVVDRQTMKVWGKTWPWTMTAETIMRAVKAKFKDGADQHGRSSWAPWQDLLTEKSNVQSDWIEWQALSEDKREKEGAPPEPTNIVEVTFAMMEWLISVLAEKDLKIATEFAAPAENLLAYLREVKSSVEDVPAEKT